MGQECFSFHQLRLLNFNKFSNHFCRTSGEIKKCPNHDEIKSDAKRQSKVITNCSVGKNSNCLKSTSKVFLQKRLRSPLTVTNCVSNRLPFGTNTSKFPIITNTHQKSRRLQDVEQKFSLYSVFSDKIKPKICSFLKSKTGSKREKSTVKQDSSRHHKGDDIQIFFDPNRFKSQKRLRKRKVIGDYRMDMLYDSKSSRDENDFKCNRQHNVNCYQLLTCNRNKFAQRHRCNNIRHRRDCTNPEIYIQKNNPRLTSRTCVCSKPVHYNLVDFPCHMTDKGIDVKNSSCRNCNYNAVAENQRSRISREVLVTPSCLFISKSGAGDSATRHHSLDSKIQAVCVAKHTGNGDSELLKCKYRKCPEKPIFSLFSVYCCNNPFVTLIKSVIKKMILGLAIIAWSPCIISVWTYWLITYPLRPQHIFTQAKIDERGKCKSCGNLMWHCIFHSIARALEKVVHAYNILVSSIKNQKSCVHDTNNIKPCLPQLSLVNRCLPYKLRQLHINANPKERYTLCYTRRRGWVIKASRKYPNRKRNSQKCYHKNINIAKKCDAMKHKKYSRIFPIHNCKTLPSFKNSPCIQIFKNGHKEINPKRNIRTYLSKMVSTKSSPVLRTSSSIIVNPLSKYTLTKKYNTSDIVKRKGKSCTCLFRDNLLVVSNENIEMNTRKRNIAECSHSRDVVYNPQIHLRRQKHQELVSNNYQCTGVIKGKTGWIPCSYSHRKIVSHNERPCCPKITFVKPSKRRTRTKYVLLSRDNVRKLKHTTCENQFTTCENQFKKLTMRQKLIRCYKNIKTVVCATDTEVWESDDICKDMYVSSLRKKPWLWIYKRYPSFYPYFLEFIRFNVNCVHCFLLMISSCIWFPIICCCYYCCSLIFECL